jgi:flagellar basal body rod protein FlgC
VLSADTVDMLQTKNAFLANMAVFKTNVSMAATRLNAIG